jgi:hypothetical protein
MHMNFDCCACSYYGVLSVLLHDSGLVHDFKLCSVYDSSGQQTVVVAVAAG